MLRTLATLAVLSSAPAAWAADGDLGSSSPATLQWQVADIPVLRRVSPGYPSGVDPSTVTSPVACRTVVRINGEGVPFDTKAEGCPEAFAAESERAASDWRWAPLSGAGERRVTMTFRFAGQTLAPVPAAAAPTEAIPTARATAPVIPPAPAATAAGTASANLVPVSATSSRSHVGEGDQHITCSGSIVRNRVGQSRKVDVAACPPELADATREVLKILSKVDAPAAPRGTDRVRVQPVQIAFTIGEV